MMTLRERALLGNAASTARAAERRRRFLEVLAQVRSERAPIKRAARITNTAYRTARRYAAAAEQI